MMRRLAGGVSIITARKDDDITGMTVTSLASLSADPPRLLVNIHRQASSFPLIQGDQLGIHLPDAKRGIDVDREGDAERDEEDLLGFADAEPDDHQGQQGDDAALK